MKITEKMLLEGYKGICNDTITAISVVNDKDIRWTYRKPKDGDYQVVTEDRDEAEEIFLEFDRDGTVPLDDDLSLELIVVAEKHAENCQKEWGDKV